MRAAVCSTATFLALLLAAPLAWADTAGPDDFGYLAEDQDEATLDYEWVPTAGGTAIPDEDYEDDTQWGPFPLGFTFEFYGVEYDEVSVLSNGMIVFDTLTTYDIFEGSQCPLPLANQVDGMVAFFQRDFNPSDSACGDGCSITYLTGGEEGSRYWALSFEGVPVFRAATTEPADPVTAQVVLYEGTNRILIQVEESGVNTGGDAVVGIEAQDGIAGLSWGSCLTEGSIPDQTAIAFNPPTEGTPVVPPDQFAFDQPGSTLEYTFTVFNLDGTGVTFDLAASGNEWDTTVVPTELTVAAGDNDTFDVTVVIAADASGGDADTATITLTPQGGGDAITVETRSLVQDAGDDWQDVSDMPLLVDQPIAAGIGTDLWVLSGTGYDDIGLTSFVTDFVQVLHLGGEFREWEFSFLCAEDFNWDAAQDCCADEGGTCGDAEAGTLTPMPEPRVNAVGCAVDDQIFVVGGIGVGEEANFVADTVFIYDTSSDTWTEGATMPEGRFEHMVVCDEERGLVFVIGGFGPFPEDPEASAESSAAIWAYDVAADSWDDTLTAMDGTRVTATAELIDADTILVAGGFFDDTLSLRTDLYDIGDDAWTRTGDLPWERFYHASAALPPARMCVIGGTSFAEGVFNPNDDSYDCYSNGFWIPQQASIGQARTRITGTNMGDSMVLVGGVEIADDDDPFNPAQYDQVGTVERYPTGTLPPEPPVEPTPDVAPDSAPDAGGDTTPDTGGGDVGGGGDTADGGGDTGGDAATGGDGGEDDGCGCASSPHDEPASALLMLALLAGLIVQTRRR